jgi:hypothetical protein
MTRDHDRIAHLMGEPSGPLEEGERAALDDLRELLADPALWAAPDPSLEHRIVEAIVDESLATQRQQARAPERPDRAGWLRRFTPVRLGFLAGAAAAVIAGVLAAGIVSNGDSALRFEAALAAIGPSQAAGTATLTRTRSGWEVVLEAKGLPRLDNGRYYQAWLRNPNGILVSIGSFNEGGRIVLWSGVSPVDYPQFTITAEEADGNQASSGQRVLAGTVDTSR